MDTALLLIDIQNDYFENGASELSGSDKACLNAGMILNIFRKKELPVIHIKHISTRPGATFFLPDTIGAEIHQGVKPLDHEKVIVKNYPNSFRETELFSYLKSINATDLVICGMMTHVCVDSTVRAAKDLGFNITLIGDACATKDLKLNGQLMLAEHVHNSFLAAMNYFYANVITTNMYLND